MRKALLITLAALLISATPAWSLDKKPLFHYGASCYDYFGNVKTGNISRAIIMVKRYFAKKDLQVKFISHSGRFIKVEVYKGKELADTIVVDIATGKMRSIQ